jgi:oxygen-independent coproporphyrinogen-3 oxidase
VSSFARPGAEARHNAVYWSGAPYLGLGNGAHSYAPPIRRWNVRDWDEYRDALLAGRSPELEREAVGTDAHALEHLWLSLRTRDGIPRPAEGSKQERVTRRWVDERIAVYEEDRLRLTPDGWLVLDSLVLELDAGA